MMIEELDVKARRRATEYVVVRVGDGEVDITAKIRFPTSDGSAWQPRVSFVDTAARACQHNLQRPC